MKTSHATLVVLASCGVNALAHAQAPHAFLRPSRPLESVAIDLTSGTVTRGAATLGRSASTVLDFDNDDLSGFVGVDTGGGFCEWFDAGTKGAAGNRSDLMDSIVFAYCSAMLDPSLGGPGGAVKLGFYEGYTFGGGAPSTAVAAFTLTGLPAHSTSSTWGRRFSCYLATVQFDPLVSFADGPIGYSWKFLDVVRFGSQAGTWPILSCVTSCSGSPPHLDGQGMTDALDEYCPPGVLRASFSFGTGSGTYTSISMGIREAADLAATSTAYNAATTPNPDTLAATAPVLGSSWTATLTRGASGPPGSMLVRVRTQRLVPANGVQAPAPLPVGAGGRILIAGSALGALSALHDGLHGSVSAPLPRAFDLLCVHFAAQAIVLGGGARLSSAVEGTLGTF